VTIEALNFPVICFPVSATINLDNHPHLNGIQLADKSNASDPIDVLISSDYYWDIVGGEIIQGQSGPVAISSKFGWLLSGPTEEKGELKTTTNLIISGSSKGPFDKNSLPTTSCCCSVRSQHN
jgi:hypothetical protein